MAASLLVEEETPEGLRFNPARRPPEEGESLLQATVREVLEETAHHFEPEYLVGIYQWTAPRATSPTCASPGGVLRGGSGRPLDEGIVRAVWLTLDEVRACADRHRSPLILQCIEDWIAGQRHPLALVHHR